MKVNVFAISEFQNISKYSFGNMLKISFQAGSPRALTLATSLYENRFGGQSGDTRLLQSWQHR